MTPFDPNAALRNFNAYFADLRKQYGDAGLRQMGFSPRDLAAMQGTLRRLQMDPNATPEQHQQAYQQARDALAQRITTPAMTPVAAAPTPVPVAPQPMPVMTREAEAPPFYAEYLASLNAKPVALQPAMPVTPTPQPVAQGTVPPEIVTPPPPMPDVSNYIANMNAPAAQPAAVAAPSMNTQPGADFDRNVFTKMLNGEFAQLQQKYGNEGLRAAGFTPSTLAGLQGGLRKLQMDPTSTYDQNNAALENALAQLRGYNFGTAPQTVTPAPMPQTVAPPMIGDGPLRPTADQMSAYNAAVTRGETGAWLPEAGTFLMKPAAQPEQVMPPATPAPPPIAAPEPVPVQPIPGFYRGGFAVRG